MRSQIYSRRVDGFISDTAVSRYSVFLASEWVKRVSVSVREAHCSPGSSFWSLTSKHRQRRRRRFCRYSESFSQITRDESEDLNVNKHTCRTTETQTHSAHEQKKNYMLSHTFAVETICSQKSLVNLRNTECKFWSRETGIIFSCKTYTRQCNHQISSDWYIEWWFL